MSSPAVTIEADTPFPDALKLMRERHFRRLPVVDRSGRLVGIVSERDLLYAAPSSATSLSIWEVQYLLSNLHVKTIMTKDVITTTPDTPVEDAAQSMVTHKIGGLPVVDGRKQVVGVITETDIFQTFVEMFAGGRAGVRLTLSVPEKKGVLLELGQVIYDLGGTIVSVGSFDGRQPEERGLVIKVRDVDEGQLVTTLDALGEHIVDVREV
jgi:acetoin utilization protein AcuB